MVATRARLEEANVELLWRRAASDPAWFFENCLFIPSQQDGRGREEFHLRPYQHEDLQTFLDERFAVVLKARQIGLSTLIGAYALWKALFQPGSVILWISDGQENADKAVGMLNVMWGYLPAWVKERAPEKTADQSSKKEWTFADGMKSRIRAYAGTGKAGASETASLVVLDEFALVDEQDNLLRSADPTTDAGGSLIIVSTARGAHNRFARTFRAAQRGESKFVPLFHPWPVSPFVNPLAHKVDGCPNGLCDDCVDRTIYDIKANEFADQPWLFKAEYPMDPEEAFRESGRPRFPNLPPLGECDDDWVRGELADMGDDFCEFVEFDDGPLRVRRDHVADGPEDWRDYAIYLDPATGTGQDYTAAQVFAYDEDLQPERVAWWHANDLEPIAAARSVNALGRRYAGPRGPAILAVESTGGWGDSILQELHIHLRYPRLYVHTPTGHRKRTRATTLGFPMSVQRRPLVIDRLAEYVTTAVDGGPLLGGIDSLFRAELGTFVRRPDGKVAADTGCHDDLVMSAAGGLWVLFEQVRATQKPDGESAFVAPSGKETRLSLQSMFDRIEDTRRAEEKRDREQARRAKRTFRRAGSR